MTTAQHSAASHHLPWFLTAPGESDTLFTFTTLMVIATILGLGIVFFTLHSLPERRGHQKLQFEIVAVLGLLSLLTHVHAFWVAGLLLAMIDLPDFQTPLQRMAGSLEALAKSERSSTAVAPPDIKLEPKPEPEPTPKSAHAELGV